MNGLIKAVDISLAALLSFFTQVEESFRHMEDGEYAKAAEVLTHVIGSEYAKTPVAEFARLNRAEAYIKLKIPREAQPDLAYLINHSENDELVKRARLLFAEVDGDLADFLPRRSAADTAQGVLDAWGAKQFDKVAPHISGELAAAFKVYETVHAAKLEGQTIYGVVGELIENGRIVSVRTNGLNQAEVVVQADGVYTLQMEPVAAEWRFTELKGYTDEVEKHYERAMSRYEQVRHANINRLKRLGVAVALYRTENDAYPPEYESLSEYLNVSLPILDWTHPETQKTSAFLFREAIVESVPSETLVMAAPVAFKGKREVLRVDGSVAVIAEERFKALAAQQGWMIVELAAMAEVPEKIRDKVKALLGVLKSGTFKERRAAKKRLQELGPLAYPILMEYKDSADPELRVTVQELLNAR